MKPRSFEISLNGEPLYKPGSDTYGVVGMILNWAAYKDEHPEYIDLTSHGLDSPTKIHYRYPRVELKVGDEIKIIAGNDPDFDRGEPSPDMTAEQKERTIAGAVKQFRQLEEELKGHI